MKRSVYFLLLCVISMGFYSCKKIAGKGDVIIENRTVTGYNAISLSMDANVHLQVSQENTLNVHAQENLLPYIETIVEGSRLVIKLKNNYVLGKHEQITVTIKAAGINDFNVSGSGDIFVTQPVIVNDLNMSISGSGGIKIDSVAVTNLQSMISGSGTVYVASGGADRSDLTISGSGDIDVTGVTSDKVYANISGSGNIYCSPVTYLKAVISGSGCIFYMGTPVIDTQISGSGSVIHL